MATDLVIGIGAEYVGAPAFAKANRSVFGLEKSVKSLAKTFTGLFAAQKLAAFGKASVKAFNADTQSAKRLTQTLDSLGLAFEDSRVKTLIAGMEKTYKVADDNLRPAMQSLLQVTGSVSKSQSILETALNASAGSGTDLATVTDDLAQAYVGNLKGLRKYNLGLTQAELKTKSFAQIQEVLNKKFQGQALLKAADPMQQLALAADNAKETIGKGLVDAINSAVSAGTGVNDITTNMDHLANKTAGVIRFLGQAAGLLNKIGNKIFISTNPKDYQDGIFSTKTGLQMAAGKYTKGGGKAIDIAAAARAKAEADAIKRNKELLKLAQAQAVAAANAAKAKKEAAILEKAQQLFNMDLIENVAALQGKINEDEKIRLQTQQALLTGNAQSAGELAMKLLEAQKQALMLRQTDPFLGWPDSAAAAIKSIQGMIDALKLLGIAEAASKTVSVGGFAAFQAKVAAQPTYEQYASPWQFGGASADRVIGSMNSQTGVIDINLNVVNGSVTADLQNQSLTGTPANIYRINPINNG